MIKTKPNYLDCILLASKSLNITETNCLFYCRLCKPKVYGFALYFLKINRNTWLSTFKSHWSSTPTTFIDVYAIDLLNRFRNIVILSSTPHLRLCVVDRAYVKCRNRLMAQTKIIFCILSIRCILSSQRCFYTRLILSLML